MRQLNRRFDPITARIEFLQLFEDGGDTFDALYYLAELGINAEIAEDGPMAMLRLDTQQSNIKPNPGGSPAMTLQLMPIDTTRLEFRYHGASEYFEYDRDTNKRSVEQARDTDTGYPIFTVRCQVLYRTSARPA